VEPARRVRVPRLLDRLEPEFCEHPALDERRSSIATGAALGLHAFWPLAPLHIAGVGDVERADTASPRCLHPWNKVLRQHSNCLGDHGVVCQT